MILIGKTARWLGWFSAVTTVLSIASCGEPAAPLQNATASTLRIGYGLTTGQTAQSGLGQAARILALEGLIAVGSEGRPQPRLAERWSLSADGLTWKFELRHGVTFHDGTTATADVIRRVLEAQLPDYIGPPFGDVAQIRNDGETTIEFVLKSPSALLIEGLDVPIEYPGGKAIGTAPFVLGEMGNERVVMNANNRYYAGPPVIGQLVFQPYASVRAAWADLLRDRVDMLWDVGVDALQSLEPSTNVKVFTHRRGYAYLALFNLKNPSIRNREFRQLLNAAVDRDRLVQDVFQGHAVVADGPVWPSHWARDASQPGLKYAPRPISGKVADLRCVFAEASLERLVLALQSQLSAVGVHLVPQLTSVDEFYRRAEIGDFDLLLADTVHGPSPLRAYWFWHTDGPLNWGRFTSPQVDAALDAIRHARDEVAYKSGVAAFQQAIVDDPPAIFLAWSERARAVSTRFEVPVESGRDILSTLRLWRSVAGRKAADTN